CSFAGGRMITRSSIQRVVIIGCSCVTAQAANAARALDVPTGTTIDLNREAIMLVGENALDYAGSVSGAGDVDGDGNDDVIVGACGNDANGSLAGAAYVVLGPLAGRIDLGEADAKLVGEAPG